MPAMTLERLTAAVELSEELRAGRDVMLEPQDLPGRFGRAVLAVDRVLRATEGESVLGGGWAVWRHGYIARVTEDIDIALPADQVDEFMRVAVVSGFERLPQPPGRWPKVKHKESGIKVDILPEGARPGTHARPAPTTIPHPKAMGAGVGQLSYMDLASLVELKLAAGRPKDEVDVFELIRANGDQINALRLHLQNVHADYVAIFERLVETAGRDDER